MDAEMGPGVCVCTRTHALMCVHLVGLWGCCGLWKKAASLILTSS